MLDERNRAKEQTDSWLKEVHQISLQKKAEGELKTDCLIEKENCF